MKRVAGTQKKAAPLTTRAASRSPLKKPTPFDVDALAAPKVASALLRRVELSLGARRLAGAPAEAMLARLATREARDVLSPLGHVDGVEIQYTPALTWAKSLPPALVASLHEALRGTPTTNATRVIEHAWFTNQYGGTASGRQVAASPVSRTVALAGIENGLSPQKAFDVALAAEERRTRPSTWAERLSPERHAPFSKLSTPVLRGIEASLQPLKEPDLHVLIDRELVLRRITGEPLNAVDAASKSVELKGRYTSPVTLGFARALLDAGCSPLQTDALIGSFVENGTHNYLASLPNRGGGADEGSSYFRGFANQLSDATLTAVARNVQHLDVEPYLTRFDVERRAAKLGLQNAATVYASEKCAVLAHGLLEAGLFDATAHAAFSELRSADGGFNGYASRSTLEAFAKLTHAQLEQLIDTARATRSPHAAVVFERTYASVRGVRLEHPVALAGLATDLLRAGMKKADIERFANRSGPVEAQFNAALQRLPVSRLLELQARHSKEPEEAAAALRRAITLGVLRPVVAARDVKRLARIAATPLSAAVATKLAQVGASPEATWAFLNHVIDDGGEHTRLAQLSGRNNATLDARLRAAAAMWGRTFETHAAHAARDIDDGAAAAWLVSSALRRDSPMLDSLFHALHGV